ncbi:MAG: hypothetical protein N2512_02735 [Armatimonadetes bacterium]|nr:hypothetical protein [Armatimonadota bacterium]
MKQAIAMVVAVAIAALGFAALGGHLWAQEILSVKVEPSGLVRVMRGNVPLAAIELNAHGPQWKHAPQESATAEMVRPAEGDDRRVVGTLPVPNTDGGAVKFSEVVVLAGQGLRLEYDVAVARGMKLNGLQVSILLPADLYADKEVLISHPDAEPQGATLPKEQRGEEFYVWGGEGQRVDVAKGTKDALTLELLAPADILIYDLRRWERPEFEIRFPAIHEDQGYDVSEDDLFHLDLTATFAGQLKLVGP